MYNITIFNAQKNNTKFAWSPYDDKTFVFETHKLQTNRELWNVMVSHWILNIPLSKLDKQIRSYRRKANLKDYYNDTVNYFIVDLDDVMSQEHQDYLLDYFKEYKCIIGESKSHDARNNFNMKGILFVDEVNISSAKRCISSIKQKLKEYCTVDEAVSRLATFNAPIGKNNILLNNEDKPLYKCEVTEANPIEDLSNAKEIKVDILDDAEGDTIEELCLNTFRNMGYVPIKNNENNSITFKHPSEKKSIGGYFWFTEAPYTMHHFNSTKSINIFDSIRRTELGKELMEKTIDYDDAFLNFDTNTKVVSVCEKYLILEGKEDVIQEWVGTKGGLFSIKSPMGTGKSTIIASIIEEAHNIDMKVLIITNRRSVAFDFAKKYNMKLYSKDKYNPGDSIIVQYDSLWKYNIKDFDIVVMDEFISLMMHSRSNLNNSGVNIAKFFGAFNKKLVIADAFLTGYENFLLSNKKKNIVQLENTYRDKSTLFSYDNQNYFVQELLHQAKSNKLTVSSTSLNFMNAIKLILEKRGLKVITLTAETPASTKELIYELFEKEDHDKWDVFIYSPTLTVGVSNLNNVYQHFHWDTSMSTDVISSIQMIKRTRKAKEIHMYIAERKNYLKTTYDEVRDEYMRNIGRNIEQNYLFDVDDYGEAKLSSIGRNAVKIDTFKNILEFDHKKAMLWLLKYHFLSEPRIVSDIMQESILAHPNRLIKENKDIVRLSAIDEYLHLSDIKKVDLLMDEESNTTLKHLAEIDDNIKDITNDIIRIKIINIALKNAQFINQCRYYRAVFDYGMKLANEDDIKVKVSDAVISGDANDLIFYNKLLEFGQQRLDLEYYYHKLDDKLLKFILSKIGYKNVKTGVGERKYKLSDDVRSYYGYIR